MTVPIIVANKRLAEMDDEWMVRAACRGMPTNIFYEFDRHDNKIEDVKTFCVLACSVREQCLLWALYIPETDGVWGGLSPDERAKLRKDPAVRMHLRDSILDTQYAV